MRLNRLDLTRYGKFTDTVIDFGKAEPGSPDLHIVYGLNEAGKSTAFSAWLDLLFGIPLKTGYNFLHPNETMQIGASVEIRGETHELIRSKKRQNGLTDQRGQPVNEAMIASALGGLGRDDYRTMFSLDDQSLKEGGENILKSEGDLGALLFSASAGLADIGKVLAAIRSEADLIYKPRASSTELLKLKAELSRLKEQRAQIDTQASAYAALSAAEAEARKAHDAVEAALSATRSRAADLTRLLKALPAAAELKRTEASLAGLSGLARAPQDAPGLLARLVRDETRLETQAKGLNDRIAALEDALAALPRDEAALAVSERVKRLQGLRVQAQQIEDQLPRRRDALSAQDGLISATLAAIGQPGHGNPESLLLSARTVGRLRDLIERRSGLDEALKSADWELRRLRDALEEAEAASPDKAEATPRDIEGLQRLLDRMEQGDRAARLVLERRDLVSRRKQVDEARQSLGLGERELEAMQHLAAPDSRQFARWSEEARSLARRIGTHRDTIRAREADMHAARDRIAVLTEGTSGLDDQAAADIRAERDRLWQKHLNGLDLTSAKAFEAALARDDEAGKVRLAHADRLAELRQLHQQARLAETACEREHGQLAEALAEEASLGKRVASVFPPDLVATDMPLEDALSALQRWCDRHSDYLEAATRHRETEERAKALAAEIETDIEALSRALSAQGIAIPLGSDGAALASLARRAIAEAAKQEQERENRAIALQRMKTDIKDRQRTRDDAEAARSGWQAAWAAALDETWFGAETYTGDARALIDAMVELPAQLRERDELARRIELMLRDAASFETEVRDLARTLALPADGEQTARLYDLLTLRHEKAVKNEEAAEARRKELARLEEERRTLASDIALHDAEKRRLIAALGISSLDEAALRLDEIAQRDRLEKRQDELRQLLPVELRVADLASALSRLEGLEEAQLEDEQTRLSGEAERLSSEAQEIYARLILARNRLDAVGGDSAVAAIEAERATTLLAIEEVAMRYLRLRSGALAASGALDLYREKHRSTMMTRASDAFRMITRGDYSGLSARPEKDRETLIGIARNGSSRLAEVMSTGTRYQLYLALRLAGYEEFAAVSPAVPFIADDIMETFDELRSEEVFRLFGQMAGIGQVIYLTHHRHLCDIAKSVVPSVKIHTL